MVSRSLSLVLLLLAILSCSTAYSQGTGTNPATSSGSEGGEKPKTPITRTIDTQLSAYTTEYAEQLYLRLLYQEKGGDADWHLRGSFIRTATVSGSSRKYVTTTKIDYRREHPRSNTKSDYDVWAGVMNRRDRDLTVGSEKSGYHFFSYGVGKQLDTRNRGDIGIGILETYDDGRGTRPALSCSVIARRPIAEKLSLDGQILVLQPLNDFGSTKVDSEAGMTYDLSQGFSVRLNYSANNVVKPLRGDTMWDTMLRLTFAYRHTSRGK